MKTKILVLVSVLLVSLAAVFIGVSNRTVFGNPVVAVSAPEISALETLPVEDDGDVWTVTTSPFALPSMAPKEAASHAHGGQPDVSADHTQHHGGHAGGLPPVETFTIPADGYVWGFDYYAVDADGNQLPRELIHHFNIIDPAHRDLFLPISRRLVAGGKETGAQAMPWFLFGVPVQEGQQLVISVMLHNMTPVDYDGVSLRVDLNYSKSDRPWPLFAVLPFQMDVAFPVGEKSFDLPPGTSSRSWEGSPSVAGKLLVVASHLHERATHITLRDLTRNETLWTGYPVLGEDNHLDGVTVGRLYRKLGVDIFPSHSYQVAVHYENPGADTLVAGGMGVVAGVFLPEDSGAWPAADFSDPLYEIDRHHYLRHVAGSYEDLMPSMQQSAEGGVTARGHGSSEGGHAEHRH